MNTRYSELVTSYLDGTISPEQSAELLARLRGDPALAEAFIREIRISREIEFVLGENDASRKAAVERIMYFLEASLSPEFVEQTMMRLNEACRAGQAPAEPAQAATRRHPGRVFRFLRPAMAAGVVVLIGGTLAYRHFLQIENLSGRVVGVNLFPGDVVAADKGETITVTYKRDTTWIQLHELSRIRIAGSLQEKQLHLSAGAVSAKISAQPQGRCFRITTPHAEMSVIGTLFSAAVSDRGTRCDVQDGVVRMRPAGKETYEDVTKGLHAWVRAGQDRVALPGRIVARYVFPDLRLGGYGVSGIAFDGKDVLAFMGQGVNGGKIPTICRLDGRTGKVLRLVEAPEMIMGSGYGAAAWDGKYFWGAISNNLPAAVDIETGKVVRRLTITGKKDGSPLNWLTFDADENSLWVMGGWKGDELYRIDNVNGRVLGVQKIPKVDWGIGRMAKTGDCLVLGEGHGGRMCRIDLTTGAVVGSYALPETVRGGDIAAGHDGNVWLTDWTRNCVSLVEGD